MQRWPGFYLHLAKPEGTLLPAEAEVEVFKPELSLLFGPPLEARLSHRRTVSSAGDESMRSCRRRGGNGVQRRSAGGVCSVLFASPSGQKVQEVQHHVPPRERTHEGQTDAAAVLPRLLIRGPHPCCWTRRQGLCCSASRAWGCLMSRCCSPSTWRTPCFMSAGTLHSDSVGGTHFCFHHHIPFSVSLS